MKYRAGLKPRHFLITAVTLAVFVSAIATTSPSQAASTSGEANTVKPLVELDSPIVIETTEEVSEKVFTELEEFSKAHSEDLDSNPTSRQIPEQAAAAVANEIYATFDSVEIAPTEAQDVVNAAIAEWNRSLKTNAPIEVKVFWSSLESDSLLGYAGPDGIFADGGLPANKSFPAALANNILREDVNGAERAEVEVVLNSDLGEDWFIDSEGTPGENQYDLHTVVLHELGHGLGFLGSGAHRDDATELSLATPQYTFDHRVAYQGVRLPNVADHDAALTSNNLLARISDGLSMKLHAPTTWSQGSSMSHFDETRYPAGSIGALMTPTLHTGEKWHTIGSPALGMMAQMGWRMDLLPVQPVIAGNEVTTTTAELSWKRALHQEGVVPDTYTVEAVRKGEVIASETVLANKSKATLEGLERGRYYVLRVTPKTDRTFGPSSQVKVRLATS